MFRFKGQISERMYPSASMHLPAAQHLGRYKLLTTMDGGNANIAGADINPATYRTLSKVLVPPNTPDIKKPRPLQDGVFLCMAHSEGFEPSTARFVAEYSIQLSYECEVDWLCRLSRARIIVIGAVSVKQEFKKICVSMTISDLLESWRSKCIQIVC